MLETHTILKTHGECMPARPLRVALFTDCFHETNGVGTLCREYAAYARNRGSPFLCVYGGNENAFHEDGALQELQLHRGYFSFRLDSDLLCDPLLVRFRHLVAARLREFQPDLVHITSPGDVSILGRWAASLVGVPVVASWHTNLHEYAYRRLQASLTFLPRTLRERVSAHAGHSVLSAVAAFYRTAHFLAAPNQQLVNLLAHTTGRPTYLMTHGVNTGLFTPARRQRGDSRFCIGYVGRLTPEKNVRALVDLERKLLSNGNRDFRFLVVGEGGESEWLRANLHTAEFTGMLRSEALANAFANMDALVFPSLTDTFGLVILEAMSSGVPVILTPETGSRVGVADGIDGFLTQDFAGGIRQLMRCPETRCRMSAAARLHACSRSWAGVFDDLHRIYRDGLRNEVTLLRMPKPKFERLRPAAH